MEGSYHSRKHLIIQTVQAPQSRMSHQYFWSISWKRKILFVFIVCPVLVSLRFWLKRFMICTGVWWVFHHWQHYYLVELWWFPVWMFLKEWTQTLLNTSWTHLTTAVFSWWRCSLISLVHLGFVQITLQVVFLGCDFWVIITCQCCCRCCCNACSRKGVL